MKYKVLITTSGVGSRLGELTKYTNKALVKVGEKPAISYIVESYPRNIELVVTVGYFKDQVKDFLKLCYPDRKIQFVEIKKYQGEGSSLAYSMYQAKKYLKCPFIFHACDTIVTGDIPVPSENWSGGFKGSGSSQYTSFDILNGKIQEYYDKGTINPDYLHIGLVGIKDYAVFWETIKNFIKREPNNSSLNDVVAIRDMIKNGYPFRLREFKEWYDIGNVESLNETKNRFEDSFPVLDKLGESIFLIDGSVFKFFADEEIVSNRVKRARILKRLVPPITGAKGNFYKYQYVKGDLYSETINPINFSRFLNWVKVNLWKQSREVSKENFQKKCLEFYFDKTNRRLADLFKSRSLKDSKHIISEVVVGSARSLLGRIDWKWLTNSPQTMFHGDLIPDNIIQTQSSFCLLDWRQDFAGLFKSGDMYYDLAKLNHNLTINHSVINQNLFSIKVHGNKVSCDIFRKNSHVECQRVLFEFVKSNNLDLKKVRLLTALIWLNMAPLHHHPFDLFLYYFGKLNLQLILNEK